MIFLLFQQLPSFLKKKKKRNKKKPITFIRNSEEFGYPPTQWASALLLIRWNLLFRISVRHKQRHSSHLTSQGHYCSRFSRFSAIALRSQHLPRKAVHVRTWYAPPEYRSCLHYRMFGREPENAALNKTNIRSNFYKIKPFRWLKRRETLQVYLYLCCHLR